MDVFNDWSSAAFEKPVLIILFSAVFIWATVRRKSLTVGGANTAVVLGVWVIYFAGIEWLLPLFFFFISGSLLSKLNSESVLTSDAKQGKARDAWQVICNGAPYAFFATFYNLEELPVISFLLMSVSVSIAISDTWSSEIGMYFRGRTIDILNGRKQIPGLSGGVSLAGSIAGLAGAVFSAGISVFLISRQLNIRVVEFFGFIALSGFAGMLVDSVLGSAFQVKYKNPKTSELSDTASAENQYYSGYSRMTNDVVNLLSNIFVTAVAGGILFFFFF